MTEVFLCAHRRTPIGRHGGSLAQLRPDNMAALVIDGLLDLAPGLAVDQVIPGARAIRDGADVVIAGRVESRSRAPLVLAKAEAAFARDKWLCDTAIG